MRRPRPDEWAWFLLKNVIGWLLIVLALVTGPMLPGPNGFPLFVIGFALIWLPGKRRLTARVLRGKPINPRGWPYWLFVASLSVVFPLAGILYLRHVGWLVELTHGPAVFALGAGTLGGCLALFSQSYRLLNWLMRIMQRARRSVRPWLRRHGIDLLPPRRRRRCLLPDGRTFHEMNEEIVEFRQHFRDGLRRRWSAIKPWFVRVVRVVVIVAVFGWMIKPIYQRWDDPVIRGHVLSTNWLYFALAAAMFAVFLFVFRALTWRRILTGMGHKLPVAPAVRIWSFSELARYLPGVIWQVVGRVYLSRPYGVSTSLSSVSQVLELSIFLLANIIVAVACLSAAGLRKIPADQRHWLLIAIALVPLLLMVLHPRIFYGLLNRILRRFKKPPLTQKLPKRLLAALAGWTILGLLWQSLAVWLLTYSTLGLPIDKWYVLAGSYCLAWTIGFSVGFMFPGGMGIREAVFIKTMQFVLPRKWVAANLADAAAFVVLLGFLGILLRLWAIAGELTMAGLAYLADYKGARGLPGAPGRVGDAANTSDAESASDVGSAEQPEETP